MNIFIFTVLSIIFLLLLSALFSGSESAIFALSRHRFRYLYKINKKRTKLLEYLHSRPRRLLSSILIGNLLVNISASSLFTMAMILISEKFNIEKSRLLSLEVIIMTLLILIFGEIIPKVLAIRKPERFSISVVPFINIFYKILSPFTFLMEKGGALLIRRSSEVDSPSDEELKTLVEMAKAQKIIEEREENILWNLVKLNELEVGEIMTPRREMILLDEEMTVQEAIDKTRQEKKSRYPVYRRTPDNITGWIHIKDVLLVKDIKKTKLEDIKREAFFVPEVEKAFRVFEIFRKEGVHIAFVVDEFGSPSGLVTLEDILESIFGEMIDEYDEEEDIPVIKVGKGKYMVVGDVDLSTLDSIFRNAFSEVEFERLSQLIYHLKKGIPDEGDEFLYNGIRIKVKEMDKNRVKKVMLERK